MSTFTEPLAMTYELARDYQITKLAEFGYGDDPLADPPFLAPMPTFSPGPAGDPQAMKVSPDAIVFLSVGSGPGLSKDGTFDRSFINARVIGQQGDDFTATQRLANAVDRGFLAFDSSDLLADVLWTLYITRSGGSPALLMRDSAERYHFTCSYITETETGL